MLHVCCSLEIVDARIPHQDFRRIKLDIKLLDLLKSIEPLTKLNKKDDIGSVLDDLESNQFTLNKFF